MTMSVPQISAQVDAVLDKEPRAQVIAIRAKSRDEWPNSLIQRDREFTVRWCDSILAMRAALSEADQLTSSGQGLILITPFGTNEIADDMTARLARYRVFQPEGWEMVRQLFQTREIDARLGRYSWMPQLLIDGAVQQAYAPVAHGFLDLETAWREVLQRYLQLNDARPDAVTMLAWTMDTNADASLGLLPPHARGEALAWLAEGAGGAGQMVRACIETGRTGDALALGCVCGVLYGVQAPPQEAAHALGLAAVRLERFVGDTHVETQQGRGWADAARQLLAAEGGAERYRVALERADVILKELRVGDYAYISDLLPAGFDQRMQAFAGALQAQVDAPSDINLVALEHAADYALKHLLASSRPQRADRIEMARRIGRWLLKPAPVIQTVRDGATWQAEHGAYIDWARFRLLGGDDLAEVSHAYEALRKVVIERRNDVARQFAVAMQAWNKEVPRNDGHIVPLESVLDDVVAPIAAQHPVLLLVMDGLSISIFRELFARADRLGWNEHVPNATARPLTGIAMVPTITEVSRATLLSGKRMTGTSSVEKQQFTGHAGLLSQSAVSYKPKLFHKGELSESSNLADAVRSAIANRSQQVTAIVYNAVDDHLSGPDQLHQRWQLEDLRLMLPILREARDARRIVIVTADHGHLLEDGTTQLSGSESDRWRTGEGTLNEAEMTFKGGRTLAANGANAVTCLWSETARYGGRKNGYHGGVTPQEVAVPLSVFVPTGTSLQNWQAAAPMQPEWWDLPPLHAVPAAPIAKPAAPRRHSTPATGQAALFDTEPVPAPHPQQQDWVTLLLQSPIYHAQRSLAARVSPPDDQMRKLLIALHERGGKLTYAVLAQRLAMAEGRINGLLSATRRILNVDQTPVLVVDEGALTVELNYSLMLQQFQLLEKGAQ